MEAMEVKARSAAYDKNLLLLLEYRRGSEVAGGELAELNRPLVCSIATRFKNRGVEFDELVEAGNIGLVKAINTFDFDKGCAFSTYATPLIFGEIRRFLRDDGIIKVSREQKRLAAVLAKEKERRIAMAEPTDIASIAAACGVSAEDAASAFFAISPVRSLDESVGKDDDIHTLGDVVCDEGAEVRDFERLCLRCALEKLTESQRKLVILRFFRDMSQVEVARAMGLSQVKVSREEKKILAIIRRELI